MTSKLYSNYPQSKLKEREKNLTVFDPSNLNPPFPKNCLVELSNSCNHACIFCTNPRMVRKKGFLDIALFRRFVDQAVKLGLEELGLYTTGEPFLSKNLAEFVSEAKRAGVKYVYITTNGALATPKRAKEVIDAGVSCLKFSINAASAKSYELVHGKDDFKAVIDNVRFISEYRKTSAPHLVLFASCVVTKFVEGEMEALKKMLLPLIDELTFHGVGNQGGQEIPELMQLRSSMSDAVPAPGQAPPCYMLWNRIHLTWEGYLTLCCVDYEDLLTYADLNDPKTNLIDAWNNQVIREMRKRHQTQQLGKTLCQNCLYNTKEKIYPISTIGHVSTIVEGKSDRPAGVNSVLDRIQTLDELSRKKTD